MTRDEPTAGDASADRSVAEDANGVEAGQSDAPADETVGGRLSRDPGDVVAALPHLYRGQIDRITTWRTRFDQTANWSVVVMATVLTWVFSNQNNPHYVLLIGILAVSAFLLVEAKRYQKYDAWRARVRVLEVDFFGEILAPGGPAEDEWRQRLRADLRHPVIGISYPAAVAHRLRHVYFALLTILVAAWLFRVTVFAAAEPALSTAAIPGVPGEVVAAVVALFYLAVVGLTLLSVRGGGDREFGESARGDRLAGER